MIQASPTFTSVCQFRSNGCCRLVAEQSELPLEHCGVTPDACVACAATKTPATGRANHVTASLALQVVRRHDGDRYGECQQKLGRYLRGPSLARKALNFSKAAVRHIKDGRRKLSDEQRNARLAVCRTCDLCDTERMVCRHKRCGCFLENKAGWASEDCPLGKWPRVPGTTTDDQRAATPQQDATRANVASRTANDEPLLTIGMATYDDFDGVYYSVQALRAFHAELMPNCEIVVVDNNPDSKQGEATKAFIEGACRSIARYVPYTDRRGSCPPRGHLFGVAKGKYVCCIDCHVFLMPGALKCLLDYYKAHPETSDLLHGPLVSNALDGRFEGTHMVPQWRSEMYGTWGNDPRGQDPNGEPFEIPQHGLGLFSCRKDAWLGFNPRFDGFSGGEGYIHEKFRQAGRRVLCLPGLRWLHKFQRPLGCPHKPTRHHKIKNHLIGWHELGMDLQPIVDHFCGGIGMRDGQPTTTVDRMQQLVDECGIDFRVVAPKRTTTLTGVIVGPSSFGSFQMRGKPLAAYLQFPSHNSRGRVSLSRKFDVGICVKADVPPVMREKCQRLIWDPLDSWYASRRAMEMAPADYWRAKHKQLKFDDIIATSPACEATMRAGLSDSVRVWMVPHHADPRIELGWYDPTGPIVYAGARYFVDSARREIEEAAKRIGHEVVFDHDHHAWKRLRGSALALCLRLPPYDVPLNRRCKPQVKVANAAAAGIPVLATDDPCTTSLYEDVVAVPVDHFLSVDQLAKDLERALASAPPKARFTETDWLARMKEVVES